MPFQVLLDMDPGVDDALAILLALRSPELNVRAITVSSGNAGLVQCGLNALKTLDVLDGNALAIPVALGNARPLRRAAMPAETAVHGGDGLGDVRGWYPDPPISRLDSRPAAEVISGLARECADARTTTDPHLPLTVIATGPLTNVALAIDRDPDAMHRVRRIIWMGGAYGVPGNVTPVAEFNAVWDPDAAAEVMASGIPVTAVGLDVTHRCPLTRTRLHHATRSTPVLEFARRIADVYLRFHQNREGQDYCYLHDPLAVAAAIQPGLLTRLEPHHVQICTDPGPAIGMTIIDRRPSNPWRNVRSRSWIESLDPEHRRMLDAFGAVGRPPTVDVAMGVDADGFLDLFLARLSG